tara:strand:- start:434 stop:559 length:126 start_codon:yes stop_codon:yes gene_type:complete
MKSISIFILLIYWSIILLAPVISQENKNDRKLQKLKIIANK